MFYHVTFCKGHFYFGEKTKVIVKANNHKEALKKARKRGYLLRDGWEWDSIIPANLH